MSLTEDQRQTRTIMASFPTPPSRSISPVGASRFERPYSPPPVPAKGITASGPPSIRESPTSTTSPHSMHFSSRAPRHHASNSVFSHADTVETAPTSQSISSRRGSKDYTVDEIPIGKEYPQDDVAYGKEYTNDGIPFQIVQSPGGENYHIIDPASTRASTRDGGDFHVISSEAWNARFQSDASFDTSTITTQTDPCPDRATLAAVHNIPVFDAEGRSFPFGSIYEPALAPHTRQLIIFVRHFYCGACQAYLQALTSSISPSEYFSIPTPTSIIVVGCGKPEMIPHYKRFTGCPWPIYADPSRSLFKKLGMSITMKFGGTPDYMKGISFMEWQNGQLAQVKNEIKNPENAMRKRDAFKGGNLLQIGGEFLFEEGEVVWCHRMRSMRDHAEVKVVRGVLGLDD